MSGGVEEFDTSHAIRPRLLSSSVARTVATLGVTRRRVIVGSLSGTVGLDCQNQFFPDLELLSRPLTLQARNGWVRHATRVTPLIWVLYRIQGAGKVTCFS